MSAVRNRKSIHGFGPTLAVLSLACAGVPEPPPPIAAPAALRPELPYLAERPPAVVEPRPRVPSIRWTPRVPAEGTFVTLIIEPEPRGLPLLEVTARAGDATIPLARLDAGRYVGLVAAPLGAEAIPVVVTATTSDGTVLTRQLSLYVAARDFPATYLRVARRFTAPDAATLERIRRERARVRAALRVADELPLWSGAFVKPLEGVTTSPYGQRRLFNRELRSQHTGLDIDGDTGDPVVAANSGRVALSDDLFFNGGAIFIDHGLGLFTGYFHLSRREVRDGQWVEKGQVIGRVGATGRVTGPHLHWGLYLRGAPLDPLTLLDPAFQRLSETLRPPPAPNLTGGSVP